MNRVSPFSSPLLLGFDHVERALDRAAKASSDGYPPYNIEQIGEDGLRITLAVAGFGLGDLLIQTEDSQLLIRGKQSEDPGRNYLYRGIAARQFQRSFLLAEGIEVQGAYLDKGLLHVDLLRAAVTSEVRTVTIDASGEKPAVTSGRGTPDRHAADPGGSGRGRRVGTADAVASAGGRMACRK